MTDDQVSRLALGAITFRSRSLPDAIEATADAGFDGMGLSVGQCVSALERGIALEDIGRLVSEAGLRVAELELVRLAEAGPVRHLNALVVELAELLRPDRVHVAAWYGGPEQLAEEMAQLCSWLPTTPVAFEFMAYNAVPGLPQALDLVTACDAPNASIVLDILHFFRTGAPWSLLTADTMSRVAVVQLSDVVARPRGSQVREARHLRTYPGRGTLDSTRFLQSVARTGHLPPLSVEPINDAYEAVGLALVAEEAMVATSALLDASGLSSWWRRV